MDPHGEHTIRITWALGGVFPPAIRAITPATTREGSKERRYVPEAPMIALVNSTRTALAMLMAEAARDGENFTRREVMDQLKSGLDALPSAFGDDRRDGLDTPKDDEAP